MVRMSFMESCCWLPLPEDAKLALAFCARIQAISSLRLFAGTDGCTLSTNPPGATLLTGSRSFTGS